MNPDHICMGCMADKGDATYCPNCGWKEGTEPASPTYLSPRTVLAGKYLIGRVLGHGGFGITYLAWDLNLSIKLAIKEFLPGDLATRSGDGKQVSVYTGDKTSHFHYGLEKFEDEARTLARFEPHPGIVSVRDVFRENNTAYFVMYYMEGMDLKQYLKKQGGKLDYDTALKIIMPVLDGLREVHRQGLLHRDMTPDNIYITTGGHVKILDFGAARYSMGEHSKSLSVILKPGFAPEEQYRQKGRQGAWTDIYAVAGSFYRMITGEVPPEALDRLDQDDLVPPSQKGAAIGPEAEAALLKALAVRAPDRFQTIEEFQAALMSGPGFVEAVVPDGDGPAVAPPLPPQDSGMDVNLSDTQRLAATPQADLPPTGPPPVMDEPPRKSPVALIVTLSILLFVIVAGAVGTLLYMAPWDMDPNGGPGPGNTFALYIYANPGDAQVEILSPAMDYSPGMELQPGSYQVRITSPGFEPWEQWVEITDYDVEMDIELVAEGTVTYDTSYFVTVKSVPSGAYVEIVEPISTPFTQNMLLEPGSYLFRFTLDGEVLEEWIEVSDRDQAVMVYFDLGIQPVSGENWFEPYSGMPFVWVEGGCYYMGSPDHELQRYGDESPRHEVCVDGFWMSQYEVAQTHWSSIMGYNPSEFQGDEYLPVENVSWYDAQSFIDELNQLNGGEFTFRLPTEAEWEYACRAGTETPFSFGDTIHSTQANFDATSVYGNGELGDYRQQTTLIGSFAPNNFNLYDMHGNVYEWVEDAFHEQAYSRHEYNNPIMPVITGEEGHVIRGGSWYNYGEFCRCAFRNFFMPGSYNNQVGIRVVREP